MSARQPETNRALTVEDYKHPEWCNLSLCTPYAAIASLPNQGGEHRSTGTLWGIQEDEAEVIVRLVRGDDYDPRTGRQVGEARVHVELAQHAWGQDPQHAGDVWAAAVASAGDARMLSQILARYADLAERSNRRPIELDAADCRGPRRT